MAGFILALVLLGIALLALALQRTYSALTAKELKKRARTKDAPDHSDASVLYSAVAYGPALRGFLWTVTILAAAGSFVLISDFAPSILAFITVALTLAYGFVWMPSKKAHKIGTVAMQTAVWLTPSVAWILDKVHPLFDKVIEFLDKHRPVTVHTGLYDREDLIKLIQAQRHQPDSRISPETLDLLSHTLTFGDKLVSDCMVPRRMVRAIPADTPVSPALINELHASGYSRVPVYTDREDEDEDGATAASNTSEDEVEFVGTLYLRDLITLKATGTVGDVMHGKVFYVHEDHPLEQVLDAFIKTHHHLFIVVNEFEEFVGIITIEDILEQILGAKIVDEFDQYDDVRAVAAHRAKADHKQRKQKGTETMEHSTPDETVTNPYPEGTLKHVIYEAGFRGEELEVAYAVSMAESGAKAGAHNDDESTGDDSYGLFQINMLGEMGPERRELYKLQSNEDLFDPLTNATVAFQMSEAGKDWKPWSVYKNGAFRKHLDAKANSKIK